MRTGEMCNYECLDKCGERSLIGVVEGSVLRNDARVGGDVVVALFAGNKFEMLQRCA